MKKFGYEDFLAEMPDDLPPFVAERRVEEVFRQEHQAAIGLAAEAAYESISGVPILVTQGMIDVACAGAEPGHFYRHDDPLYNLFTIIQEETSEV